MKEKDMEHNVQLTSHFGFIIHKHLSNIVLQPDTNDTHQKRKLDVTGVWIKS